MKLLVCCFVVAVTCSAVAMGSTREDQTRKLTELVHQVNRLNKSLKLDGAKLPTPGNVKDCCARSVLDCFQRKLTLLTVSDPGLLQKVQRALRHTYTIDGVEHCSKPDNMEVFSCQACDSYPLGNPTDFMKQLRHLLTRSLTRLDSSRP